jgi:uncharacterized radical SAM protein YgiQ
MAEMTRLGWRQCDAIIVTGDAYVDHPSFGSAVIARVLLDAGFQVGVIAQPRWNVPDDFTKLGRPRLFFGVTAGNVDSMVANFSPNFRRRHTDDYSPAGEPGLRPDRAVIVYCNRLRELYKGVPLVIGGIEASLRRLAHYDHWDDAVRRSILLDARADILVYGMGEKAVIEVARRLDSDSAANLTGIRGTAVIVKDLPASGSLVTIPSFDEVNENPQAFNEAFRLWRREADDPAGKNVVQAHGDRCVVQHPPALPLTQAELGRVYELPYTRLPHPGYRQRIPALETVRFSITSHRGCLGTCTFCSLAAHQGRIIQWRSLESIVAEARVIAAMPGFKGHITDVGGPTANMYGATCPQMQKRHVCPARECTFPRRCPSLKLDTVAELRVLAAVRAVPGVKKVSIGTGIRFDLLDDEPGLNYVEQLCRHYLSGQLRIAPEHVSDRVLAVMHKASHGSYARFRERFTEINRRLGRRQYLIPYFISGHPGTTVEDAFELAEYLVRTERFHIRQVQQFTPLPMTAAGAAYHTGRDPFTDRLLHVARDPRETRLQRALLQLHEPENFAYAERALRTMKRDDLVRRLRRLRPLLRSS